MMSRKIARPKTLTAFTVGLTALALVSGCGKNGSSQGGPAGWPTPEANVLTIATQPVTLSRELPGRTSAYRVAEVRARITGIVLKRHFTEGADVRAGQLLFEIDPEPYQAALDSARANLARAEASLLSAEAQARRYKDLVGTDAISQQAYDNADADAKARAAEVAAAKAAVRTAEINLGYTRVVAPINKAKPRSSPPSSSSTRSTSTSANLPKRLCSSKPHSPTAAFRKTAQVPPPSPCSLITAKPTPNEARSNFPMSR